MHYRVRMCDFVNYSLLGGSCVGGGKGVVGCFFVGAVDVCMLAGRYTYSCKWMQVVLLLGYVFLGGRRGSGCLSIEVAFGRKNRLEFVTGKGKE